ncbi:MAG: LamG domain-containing protein, partial [Patescibacteria group bacterium]
TGSGITIPDTNWHHVAYAYNGSTWAGYLDGVVVFSTSSIFSLAASDKSLFLGALNSSGFNSNASLDDMRIYNRALSPAEVLQLYNMGK